MNAPRARRTGEGREHRMHTLVRGWWRSNLATLFRMEGSEMKIHTDLPECYGGRSPLKVMSNLICKAVFLWQCFQQLTSCLVFLVR